MLSLALSVAIFHRYYPGGWPQAQAMEQMVTDNGKGNSGGAASRGLLRWRRLLALVLSLLAVGGVPGGVIVGAAPARAAAGPWQDAPMGRARLVAAVDAVGDGASLPLGLHLRLQPGWKTYWRSPGDAGLAPTLDWAGSANLAGATVAWPAPLRFTQAGLETFGYAGELVLPLTIRLATPGTALTARAGVDLLVCHEICVPQHFDLALDLPQGPGLPGAEAALLARFHDQVPGDGAAHGLAVTAVRVGEASGGGRPAALEVEAQAAVPFASPDVILETEPPLALGAPEFRFSADDRRLLARLPIRDNPAAAGEAPLVGRSVTVTVVDGVRTLERAATLAPPAPPGFILGEGGRAPAAFAAPLPATTTLGEVLLAALLGGVLLNLMPCVLPVLSLKLLTVLSHGGGARRAIRRGFLASAAGILTSFLALAGITASLKAGGAAVGWGVQFQQPVFLLFLILVVTLFACNLWGLFEIMLPTPLGDLAGAAGAHGEGRESLAGAFVTGAFATLLATPCSAPFLGTAVGFALARGTAEILAVFLALGLGLALPYLAVAVWPGLAAALPRPGRWMLGLRRGLALVLGGTALWLLVVLSALTPPVTPLLAAGLLVALVAAVALRERLPGRPGVPLLALMAVGGTLALPGLWGGAEAEGAGGEAPGAATATEAGGIPWRPFAVDAIPGLVAAGKTVFVDVTAGWCLTCKVNERLVLTRGETADRLSAPGIVAMRADWTRPDAAIARYLASFSRYGIPFYAVYGPGAPQGLALPELLTAEAVAGALQHAGTRVQP